MMLAVSRDKLSSSLVLFLLLFCLLLCCGGTRAQRSIRCPQHCDCYGTRVKCQRNGLSALSQLNYLPATM